MFESENENETCRRMRARKTSKDMADEMDEYASNPQQQQQHKEPQRHDMHHQPDERRTMGHSRERRGGSYDIQAWSGGEERVKYYSPGMQLNDGAKAKRSRDGKQEAGACKIYPTAENGYWMAILSDCWSLIGRRSYIKKPLSWDDRVHSQNHNPFTYMQLRQPGNKHGYHQD